MEKEGYTNVRGLGMSTHVYKVDPETKEKTYQKPTFKNKSLKNKL